MIFVEYEESGKVILWIVLLFFIECGVIGRFVGEGLLESLRNGRGIMIDSNYEWF